MGALRLGIIVWCGAGCVVVGDAPEPEPDVETIEGGATGCGAGYDATGVYTPYPGTAEYPTGSSSDHPWPGEDFEAYGPALPISVECASTKSLRGHLEVTAGCLDAVQVSGTYDRGRIDATAAGAFRALALGRTAAAPLRPVKWTDQGIEYRFHYRAPSGTSGIPGFKAFARYRSEDDLYVASWRMDGVVQIQRKQCGQYTTLAVLPEYGAPTPGVWHWMRFDAIGDQLELYLDNMLVLSTTSGTFGWGTVGIRADSMEGAYLDDWTVTE